MLSGYFDNRNSHLSTAEKQTHSTDCFDVERFMAVALLTGDIVDASSVLGLLPIRSTMPIFATRSIRPVFGANGVEEMPLVWQGLDF